MEVVNVVNVRRQIYTVSDCYRLLDFCKFDSEVDS